MFKLDRRKVTKDALYQSAQRLWEVHREMEDFLHGRVRSMFGLEEKGGTAMLITSWRVPTAFRHHQHLFRGAHGALEALLPGPL
jgi:hypothetical protein